jgi:hypothetical protein
MPPTTIHASPENKMPVVMRAARGLEAERGAGRVQHQVVERDEDHHQQRVERLHLRGLWNHDGHHPLACSTQVEAF